MVVAVFIVVAVCMVGFVIVKLNVFMIVFLSRLLDVFSSGIPA